MDETWTPEARESKKEAIRHASLFWLAETQKKHREGSRSCTRLEALKLLNAGQEHVIARFTEIHGFALAARYRELIHEVMEELAATSD
jgi:hypothetical protein